MHQAGVAQVVQACMPYKIICQSKPNRQHAKVSEYKCCNACLSQLHIQAFRTLNTGDGTFAAAYSKRMSSIGSV